MANDAKGDKGPPEVKKIDTPVKWTLLDEEAVKSGLLVRNPAPNAAGPMVVSYRVIKTQK
jgi:hypothetical protein